MDVRPVGRRLERRNMTHSTVTTCTSCVAKNRVPAAATGTARCAKCKAPLAWVVEADDADFDDVAASSSINVLVDLWAPWCGPCRTVSPALEELAHEFAGKVKLVKVNVDGAPRTQARFGVQGIPTLIMLTDGREVDRLIGAKPQHELRRWIEQAIRPTTA